MPFLTVLGHSNIDVQLSVAAMPGGGRSSPVTDRRTVYGGTACNIARHAAGLGVPVRLWSRVGSDFPADWRADLEVDGVDLTFDEGERTPTCYILTAPDGEQAYMMDQGAMTPPYEVPADAWDGAQWLHVGTGDPASYLPTMQAAKAADLKIAFDPGQEIHFAYDAKHFETLLNLADVFFCNDVEMEKALGLLRYGDPAQLLDHVDHVVQTHGEDGATLWGGKKPLPLPAVPAAAVDPTGAGDALRAGWYAGLHEGGDMAEALQLGMEVAAVAVTLLGPQPRAITRDDL